MRIGVVGLGRMGGAMAARLVECAAELGASISVWNRDANKAAPLLAAGASLAASPAALAADCDIMLSVLFDAAAIAAVYHGADGILAADLTGKIVIEMSTVRPGVQAALAEAVQEKGGRYVECPVGGSTGPARAGNLLGLVGAEPADLEVARPVLEKLCRRVDLVGPVGAGAALKLAINLPLLVFWQSFGEANALVRHLHLDPAWLVALFAETSGGPNMLRHAGANIAAALSGAPPGPANFDIDSIRKDLRTMADEAAGQGLSLPLVSRCLALFDDVSAHGWGQRDGAWLPAYWAEHAGDPVA